MPIDCLVIPPLFLPPLPPPPMAGTRGKLSACAGLSMQLSPHPKTQLVVSAREHVRLPIAAVRRQKAQSSSHILLPSLVLGFLDPCRFDAQQWESRWLMAVHRKWTLWSTALSWSSGSMVLVLGKQSCSLRVAPFTCNPASRDSWLVGTK